MGNIWLSRFSDRNVWLIISALQHLGDVVKLRIIVTEKLKLDVERWHSNEWFFFFFRSALHHSLIPNHAVLCHVLIGSSFKSLPCTFLIFRFSWECIWLYGQGEEGEKDKYSCAVFYTSKFMVLIYVAPFFKIFLFINSLWFEGGQCTVQEAYSRIKKRMQQLSPLSDCN